MLKFRTNANITCRKTYMVNPSSKAESKGVREGDLITSINGQSTKCLTNSESHALLRTVKENLRLGLNEDKNSSPRRRSKEIKSTSSTSADKEQSEQVNQQTNSKGDTAIEGAKPSSSKSRRQRRAKLKMKLKEILGYKETKGHIINMHPDLGDNCEKVGRYSEGPSSLKSETNSDTSSVILYDNYQEVINKGGTLEREQLNNNNIHKNVNFNKSITPPRQSQQSCSMSNISNSSGSRASSPLPVIVPVDVPKSASITILKHNVQNATINQVTEEITIHNKEVIVDEMKEKELGINSNKITTSNDISSRMQPKHSTKVLEKVKVTVTSAGEESLDKKQQTTVIIHHPDDICEESVKFLPPNDITELTVSLQPVEQDNSYELSVNDLHTPLITHAEEKQLRTFLQTLNLNTPEDIHTEEVNIVYPSYLLEPSMSYYMPKRHLDVISEETSDLSDVDKPNNDAVKRTNCQNKVREDWENSLGGIDTSWRNGKSLEEVSDVLIVSDSLSDTDILTDDGKQPICGKRVHSERTSQPPQKVEERKKKVTEEVHINKTTKIPPVSIMKTTLTSKPPKKPPYEKPVPSVAIVKNVISSYYNSKYISEPITISNKNVVSNEIKIDTIPSNKSLTQNDVEIVYIDSSDSEPLSTKSANSSFSSIKSQTFDNEQVSANDINMMADDNINNETQDLSIKNIISDINQTVKDMADNNLIDKTSNNMKQQKSLVSVKPECVVLNSNTLPDRRFSFPISKNDVEIPKENDLEDGGNMFSCSSESFSSQSTAKHYYLSQVLSLKELCSNVILSLPNGLETLKQLGIDYSDLEQYSGYIPEGSECSTLSRHPISEKELKLLHEDTENEVSVSQDFPTVVEPIESSSKDSAHEADKSNADASHESVKENSDPWIGVQLISNPQLLVCFSPSQLNRKSSPCDLIDLHKKFIERRGYHEKSPVPKKSSEYNKTDSEEVINDQFIALKKYHASRQEKMKSQCKISEECQKAKINQNIVELQNEAQLTSNYNSSSEKEEPILVYNVTPRKDSENKTNDKGDVCKDNEVGTSRLLELIQNLEPESSISKRITDVAYHRLIVTPKDVAFSEVQIEFPAEETRSSDDTSKKSGEVSVIKQPETKPEINIDQVDVKQEKVRPKSLPQSNDVFRKKMYDEYMDKLAALAERRQMKIIRISPPISNTSLPTTMAEIGQIESEFMIKVKERMNKLGLTVEDGDENDDIPKKISIKKSQDLPKHLQELMEITEECGDIIGKDGLLFEIDQALSPERKGFLTLRGVWSPAQTPETERKKYDFTGETKKEKTEISNVESEPQPAIWTPKSAGASPTLERKYRAVNFQSPPPKRKEYLSSKEEPELPKDLPVEGASRLVTSASENSTLSSQLRLPPAQNPTITLLQKAREGQIPKGAQYLEASEILKEREIKGVNQDEILYTIKKEYTTTEDERTKKIVELSPRKFEGIGPTTREGIPTVLRSEIKEDNQQKWYKRMYDSLHKADHDKDFVTVRYKTKRRGQYPFTYSGGYASEPERLGYDSDISVSKYATLDRRKIRNKENDFTTSTMPRNKYAPAVKHALDIYKNQPGKIEDYEPGHSSIAEKETIQWWDEVLDIFDGELNQQSKSQYSTPRSGKSFTYALKDTGYESDSTLVFKRRENMNQLSPTEQKMAYKVIQRGGDVPLHGLRKPAPERPKEDSEIEYFPISPTLTRIRVHKKSTPVRLKEKVFYPVTPATVEGTRHAYGAYKKSTSRSSSIPSPPRRQSSRNSSTLKMYTRMSSPEVRSDCMISREASVETSRPKLQPSKIRTVAKKVEASKTQYGLVKTKKELLRKSPELKAPAEVKKALKDGKTVVKSSTTLYSTSRNKKPTEDKSVKVTVAISSKSCSDPKGKELLSSSSASSKTDLRKASPLLTKNSNSSKTKPMNDNKKLNESTQSLIKSSRPSSRASTISSATIDPISKKQKKEVKEEPKKKKEKKPEVIVRNLDKAKDEEKKKIKKKNENGKKKNGLKKKEEKDKENVPDEAVEIIENEVEKPKSLNEQLGKSDNFFQHLLLREMNSPTPSVVSTVQRTPSVTERAKKFIEQSHSCYKSEPSLRNLHVYLSQRKPVSESRFRSLDRGCSRALSPFYGTYDFYDKLDKFDRQNNVWDYSLATPTYETVKGGRSSSEPPCTSPSPTQNEQVDDSTSPAVSRSPSCRRIRRSTSKTVESVAGVKRKSRSKSLNEADRHSQMGSTSSLSLSHVPDQADYQSYVFELLHSTRKSERFKELHKFYSSLERMAELEKTTSNTDLRPRLKGEEIIDFDRWKQLRNKERAEAELNTLYQKLMGDQKEKDLLFQPKETIRWTGDRGLRNKEKSVEDLRQKFQKIVESAAELKKKTDLMKDVYKPLWRGSSVMNLANSLTAVTASKRGRPVCEGDQHSLVKPSVKISRDIGSRLWSSLSMEQVNALKCQLSEIYSTVSNLKRDRILKMKQNIEDYEMNVSDLSQVDPALHVRCNSLLSTDQLYSPSVKRKDFRRQDCMKADSISTLPHWKSPNKSLSENEKKKLSMTLSAEIKERISKRKKHGSLVIPRETLGAVAAIKGKKFKSSGTSETSPRTCYSLLSDESVDKQLEKNKDFLLVLTPKEQQNEVKKMVDDWSGKEFSKAAPTSSSSSSASTVIHLGSKDEFKIVEPKYSEIIQSTSECSKDRKRSSPTNKTLYQSQSFTDLKDLFGEKYNSTYATLPLRNIHKPYFHASSDSLCKSISPDPMKYYRAYLSVVKAGDVRKLKEKFESYDDLYNLRKESPLPKMFQSDPDLTRDFLSRKGGELSKVVIKGQELGDVQWLRKKYEPRKVSPVPFRLEDRHMPHINVISKTASLQQRALTPPPPPPINRCIEKTGNVERLRQQFEIRHGMSLLGQMYTSTPEITELRDIAPYLECEWAAHRNPRSLHPRRRPPLKRRPASASPVRPSILKNTPDIFANQHFDPEVHRPSYRYQPDRECDRFWHRQWNMKPTVTFKEPLGNPIPTPPRDNISRPHSQESPHRYVESEVNIHYRSPVRSEAKAVWPEEELAERQAEIMRRIYQEQRRTKYLNELHDMYSRRHTDNFIPSQKSPIPLNRYDDFPLETQPPRPRDRTPEPKLVARALYNFVGQTSRELSFRRGDIIYVRRQIDKNWYEGEHNAMIGLFPFNYVEIIPYDGIRTLPKKANEGQARAKFNFQAQTHLELSLVKGELVLLTRRVDENWFEGRIGNRKGIFPVSYVEVLVEPGERPMSPTTPVSTKPIVAPASHSVMLNGAKDLGQQHYQPPRPALYSSTSLPAQSKIGDISLVSQTLHIDTQSDPVPYRVLYNYKPQNDDELELKEGDVVYVMEKCDDGWYVGSLHRNGQFGTFPGNYVERIQ
ncbi:uncharacterized protein isoform X3 [Rhodnius prolixus]|uniref:uncharacterized protein isoform X3 n=1 Tax=Rhodnius prolixus TaxID=13249 RepID=UPI003D18B7E5